jgi:pimeloyl-ACP methyl ester carboxylesterase
LLNLVDTNVNGIVIKGKGHWLMEEAPDQVIPQLLSFVNKQAAVLVKESQR